MTETQAPTCAKHPKEVTYVRCASCDTPICDRCMVSTAVGYKCRACATPANAAFARLSPLAGVAAVAVGLVMGGLAGLVAGAIGLWGVWLGLFYGRFAGTAILRAAGNRAGTLVEILAGVSLVAGSLGAHLALWFARYQTYLKAIAYAHGGAAAAPGMTFLQYLQQAPLMHLFPAIITLVVAAAAVSRLRWSGSLWGF